MNTFYVLIDAGTVTLQLLGYCNMIAEDFHSQSSNRHHAKVKNPNHGDTELLINVRL